MNEEQVLNSKSIPLWEQLLKMDKLMHSAVTGFFSRYKRIFLPFAIVILIISIISLFALSITYLVPLAGELSYRNNSNNFTLITDSVRIEKSAKLLSRDVQNLQKKLDKKTPNSPYLIVNTSKNKFYLYNHKKLIGKGRCSTGSYIMLSRSEEQQWIFKTPKGIFTIKGKTTQPVWVKPDWAFVEEGLPIPTARHSSRYEYGVLGDYALALGQGYMIHGTLYQRFLGMPVTHGCIRLNDDDLKLVYTKLNIGSKVFIY